jgi:hypothetical protein
MAPLAPPCKLARLTGEGLAIEPAQVPTVKPCISC